jgi:phenylacetate-coenzyme A ligase PaaK-like adenylate-forming protein
VDAWRAKVLAELLAEAARDVPLQRARFQRAGFNPASVRSVDDLHRLPPITKAQLRHCPEADRLSRRRAAAAMWQLTSGSSGEPFRFAFDPCFHSRSNAVRAFVYRSIGVRHGPVVEMYAAPGSSMRPDAGVAGFGRYILDYGLPVAERLHRLLQLSPRVL